MFSQYHCKTEDRKQFFKALMCPYIPLQHYHKLLWATANMDLQDYALPAYKSA